jgi:radical SAM superfamily enzyme YgiQ (UPF0313 family)
VRAIKPRKKGSKVILGGAAALCPTVFDSIIDVACVGEGRNWLRTFFAEGYDAACALPESWIPGESRTVIPSTEFAWDMPPVRSPDGIVRVFASRGCRYRCLFCQTGWEMPYESNPNEGCLMRQISQLKQAGEKISIMTNDGAEAAVRQFNGHEFVSLRLDNLAKMMPITKAFSKNVRIGVEGVSERLRRAIGKPIKSDDLLSATYDLLKAKIQTRWFFIIGLPGETDADWAELDYLAKEAASFPWGFVFFHFHSFMPMPATPLGVLPVVDEYYPRVMDFKHRYYRGTFFTPRVQLLRFLVGYKTRMIQSVAKMGATEAEVRRGWWDHDNPNWRVRYQAGPDDLRKYARIYAKHVGLVT